MKYLTFKPYYFIATLLLFLIECLIAIYFKTGFIRHTFGDYLVVILMYCGLQSFLKLRPMTAVSIVLLFAYLIEILQALNLLSLLGLEHSYAAKIILGSTFHYSDLIAYTLGALTLLFVEHKRSKP